MKIRKYRTKFIDIAKFQINKFPGSLH